ncbi:MAG: uroporphyrinogen-III C-methyltransferase [Cyanobacteriota bacterium]|nr:uroporphyrinogen-III C-methyltransferase [Cyanobacteriota bacterium]
MLNSGARTPPGKVYLVGAGPGDPGLFTLKGKTLLQCADVVIHDALVSPPILAMINPQAEVINAGKRRGRHSMEQAEISQLIIEKADSHSLVVRLKGGDPFIFGRGGEEMAALVEAGIEVEVVPGITAGVAAPAYAGIPLTHRDQSSSVAFVTGHEAVGKYRPQVNWQALAQGAETLVVYMGLHNLASITLELLGAGLSPETPVALIRWGTHPQQQTLVGQLGTIAAEATALGFDPPAVAVIGRVVGWHGILPHCSSQG